MKQRVYAYVTSEVCAYTRAARLGEMVGDTPVSRHGDYWRWLYGKRETLDRAANHHNPYDRRAARAVADLLGWS